MTDVVFSPHPLIPAQGQQRFEFPLNEGTTLRDIIESLDVRFEDDIVIFKNGVKFEKDDWDQPVAINDFITVKATVHGGDGSNPIATIAMIALLVAAPYVGAWAGIMTGSTTAMAVAKGVFLVGGMYLINSLFPPSLPPTPDTPDTSPTYSLQGVNNRARIDEPIPLVIGTHKFTPDLGAKPFTEFQGEDQYLYQVFHFGMNTDVDISSLKIGEDNIDNYQDVSYEFSTGSTGELTLFPGNVDTTEGGALTYADGAVTRTSSINTTSIGIDLEGTIFRTNSKGKFRLHTVDLKIEYRPVGGSWVTYDTVTIGSDKTKPIRKQYTIDVSEGQYEVRVTRQTPDDTDDKHTSNINWVALKSYQKDSSDYTGQKRMGLRIRASGQLNGVVDSLSAIVSAKCPVWNGSSWVTQATSNPAWWFLYFARGRYSSVDGRLEFGAGLADSLIDIDGLKEWGAWCDSKGLEVNYVFDQSIEVADLLNVIARCGRGTYSHHTGKLGVVYDNDAEPVSQVFGMSNIIEDTFEVTYISEQLADQVVVEFINKDLDYKPDEVRVNVPGVTTPVNPVRLRIPGVTSITQAAKEANLTAAEQFYRRRRVTFETDYEGLMVSKGNVAAVSHDLTSWAYSGRLTNDGNHSTTKLYLDHDVTFDDGPGNQYYVRVRHPDGTSEVVRVAYHGSAEPTNQLNLTQTLSQDPSTYPDNEPGDAIWQFEPDAVPGKLLKVIAVEVVGEDTGRVRLTLTDENPDYYTAEGGSYTYDTGSIFNTAVASISNLQFAEELQTTEGPIEVTITWDMTSAYGARVRIQRGNQEWEDHGDVRGRSYSFTIQEPETITVQLTSLPLDSAKMSSTTISNSYAVQGIYYGDFLIPVVPDVTGLELENKANDGTFEGKDAKFTWRKIAESADEFGNEGGTFGADAGGYDPDFKDFEVRIYSGATLLRTEHTYENTYVYTYEKNYEDNNASPVRTFTINVYARGKQNQLSLNPARLTVSNPAPSAVTGLTLSPSFSSFSVDVLKSSDADYEGIVVNISTSSGFTPSGTDKGTGNCVYRGPSNAVFIADLIEGQTYYVKVAAYDSFGPDSLNYSTEVSTTTAAISFNEKTFSFDGIVFQPNDPSSNKISWTAGNANYHDGTSATQYAITSGNATWSTGILYVYYTAGETILRTTTNLTTAMADNKRVLGSYKGGNDWVGANGDAYIDGSRVIAGTVGASQLVAGSAVITQTAQIANLIVKDQHVDTLSGAKITVGTLDGDRIVANSITADEMAANSITAANGAISDLTVSTVKIQDQAVTIPMSTDQVGSIFIDYSQTKTVVSHTYTSTGAPVFAIGQVTLDMVTASMFYDVQLYQDATLIGSAGGFVPSGGQDPVVTVIGTVTPSTGSTTIYLKVEMGATSKCNALNGTLFSLETKK